jgi:hypothetical protein
VRAGFRLAEPPPPKSHTAKLATMIAMLTIGKRRAGMPSESGSTRQLSHRDAICAIGDIADALREAGKRLR